MTEQRHKKIIWWGETIKEIGAAINDVTKLESSLKFPISVKALTGEILRESKYKNNCAQIDITCHNGHAWGNTVTIFPQEKVIRYIPDEYAKNFYEGKVI